jgi:hypothetical protein
MLSCSVPWNCSGFFFPTISNFPSPPPVATSDFRCTASCSYAYSLHLYVFPLCFFRNDLGLIGFFLPSIFACLAPFFVHFVTDCMVIRFPTLGSYRHDVVLWISFVGIARNTHLVHIFPKFSFLLFFLFSRPFLLIDRMNQKAVACNAFSMVSCIICFVFVFSFSLKVENSSYFSLLPLPCFPPSFSGPIYFNRDRF